MKPSHGRLAFVMPAPSAAAFEAFFNHEARLRWDTLLEATHVEGGGTHPYAGAISTNRGRGWKGAVTMRTPEWLEALLGWAGNMMFAWQTRRRFKAMAAYLRDGG